MSSILYSSYPVIYYILNNDFIVKNLCVQKDNQQGCNGKCYLKKQIKKNNKRAKDSKLYIVIDSFKIYLVEQNYQDIFNVSSTSKRIKFSYYKDIISKYIPARLLDPPEIN